MIVEATPLWSRNPGTRLKGLCLAREKGWLLAWDRTQWLYLFDPTGKIQAQVRLEEPIVAAAMSDDGSLLVAVTQDGTVRSLQPDLSTRWQRSLKVTPLTVATSSLGDTFALTDTQGGVHFLRDDGTPSSRFESPRPLHHVAFLAEAAALVGCADFGLVGSFDAQGKWLWRDAPVINSGDLAVTGSGSMVLLASFSEGVQRFGPKGEKHSPFLLPEPCPLVAISYRGDLVCAAGMAGTLYFLSATGKVLAQHKIDKGIQDLTVSALGTSAYVVTKEGELMRLNIGRRSAS